MTAIFKENDAPPTPPAGYVAFYCKTDGLLYYKDDAGVELPIRPVGGGTGDLLSDGTVPLTANWDVGAFKIIAQQLESDVATGTAPFIVASETLVTNLNAEFLGGTDLAGIQALIDAAVVGLYDHKGAYDASTNTPDLDTAPSGIKKGDAYTVSVAGTFFAVALEAGDVLIADQDDPVDAGDWTIVQTNLTAATIKSLYESNADTNAFTDAEQTKLAGIEAAADVTDATNVAAAGAVMDGDFSADEGMMRKSAAGTYTTIKTNLNAAVDPTVNDDSGDGYSVYSPWVNTTDDKIFFCLDATVGAAVWQEVGAGTGAGGLTPVFKTANYTAVAGEAVYCDTAGGAFTVTLPATPGAADNVKVIDATGNAGTNNITVGRNGETINGAAADFVIDQNFGQADLAYDGTATDWQHALTGGSLTEAEIDARLSGVQGLFLRPEHDLTRANGTAPSLDSFDVLGSYGIGKTYTFSAAGDDTVYWVTRLPNRWDLGSMRFRFYWKPESTNTGVCRWRALPTNPANDGETMFGSVGAGFNADDAGLGVTGNLQITNWTSAMAQQAAAVAGDLISVVFQRNGAAGADTFTGTATLIGIEVEWTSNAPTDA